MALRLRDDLGREHTFGAAPRRIVSLVPSETYNLFALGAGDRLVGRTRYCVEPSAEVAEVAIVGGTKDADPERVAALEPDLVLANQEENTPRVVDELVRRGLRVLVSFPKGVADAVAHLARLARVLATEADPSVRDRVRRGYRLISAPRPEASMRVFVPIWHQPLMTFRADTYAHDVLEWAGLDNVFADRDRHYPLAADLGRARPLSRAEIEGRDTRYPRLADDELCERAPELILLPDEPYAFGDDDAARFAELLPTARIARVSGKDLFWSGAWTVDGVERLRRLVAARP